MTTPETDNDELRIEASRLLPRISFRTMFLVTLGGALLFAVARAAGVDNSSGNGSALATGLIAGILFIALVATLLSAMFAVAWLVALVTHTAEAPAIDTDGDLPPQIIPPRDPVL